MWISESTYTTICETVISTKGGVMMRKATATSIVDLFLRKWFTVLTLLSLVLIAIPPQFGQNIDRPPAISLDLVCPSYSVSGKQPIRLFADILGTEDVGRVAPLVFRWSVSPGSIQIGQGTSTIVISNSPNLDLDPIVVRVGLEVPNGPPELSSQKTCSINIKPTCRVAPPIDQYGVVPLDLEQTHLDRFANLLNTTDESVGYIISYAGKSACLYEASWRADRAVKYLIEKHHLSASRLVAVDGGYRDQGIVELFVQPNSDCGPLPIPTRRRVEVHVEGRCSS